VAPGPHWRRRHLPDRGGEPGQQLLGLHLNGCDATAVPRSRSGACCLPSCAQHSRVAGCLRFLGGSATCTEKYVQFYADDDGSGQQRWVLTPVVARSPPPPPPSPPPPPVCTPGYGVEGGACAKCAAGTYSPGGAETECKPCAPGSHSPSPGWAFCLGCKGNTIAAGWGAAECTVCYAPDRRRVLLGSVPLGCTNGAHSECDPCCGNRRRRGLLGC
jgi:hypothetical protein